ncbi:hypothetical protein SEA_PHRAPPUCCINO_178 [Mycobacterium phage Phrappuccino]|uniref:Uncharacterized protein n=1 Tax=Mycobacterium phage Phrappuccino TaxID=2591223 RepID=A0A514DE11_9CAUD|nr:hypothetical protein KHQ87_gp178 [Mycobacterium phage Phrappuccino]QDH91853.1 hypothetical protein SEA_PHRAPPUCCINO_178 [Mycobacterium phage Phrappuccino]QIQ63294.1 hypothetical protein SEA_SETTECANDELA_178 [Mycobacterium phage Settecandela]
MGYASVMTNTAATPAPALKWTVVRPGTHASTDGAYVIERATTVTNGWVGVEWRVFFRGEQVRTGSYLSDAKREASAHASQFAAGLV